MEKIRLGICGYGNLGRGAIAGLAAIPDMEVTAVFTRRALNIGFPVVNVSDAEQWRDKIDVMLLCGGSAKDLPEQGPEFARMFNTVDSFDTHAKIPEYRKVMDSAAREGGNLSVISVGWDPGLFSLMRLYMGVFQPIGQTHSFWGEGVSQGHSDAVRRIEGVEGAVQYTIPNEAAIEAARVGAETGEKHKRVCYVVASGDHQRIEDEIKRMPHYFADYDTTVHFITQEELAAKHNKLPHAGRVIRAGEDYSMEFSHKMDSNPEYTASILLAYARAAYKMAGIGEVGARTVFDVPPILLADGDMMDLL